MHPPCYSTLSLPACPSSFVAPSLVAVTETAAFEVTVTCPQRLTNGVYGLSSLRRTGQAIGGGEEAEAGGLEKAGGGSAAGGAEAKGICAAGARVIGVRRSGVGEALLTEWAGQGEEGAGKEGREGGVQCQYPRAAQLLPSRIHGIRCWSSCPLAGYPSYLTVPSVSTLPLLQPSSSFFYFFLLSSTSSFFPFASHLPRVSQLSGSAPHSVLSLSAVESDDPQDNLWLFPHRHILPSSTLSTTPLVWSWAAHRLSSLPATGHSGWNSTNLHRHEASRQL
jgi:hypothetical protein